MARDRDREVPAAAVRQGGPRVAGRGPWPGDSRRAPGHPRTRASPKSVLVIAGVWVGDAFSRTQRGGAGSDRAVDAADQGAVSSVARSAPGGRGDRFPLSIRGGRRNAKESTRPCHSQNIAHRGACGNARVMLQHRRRRPVCTPPDCAELLGNVGVPLVPIGGWR
jgi:hypothetical protein